MQTIIVRNVHQALPEAVRFVKAGLEHGYVVEQDSRNGPVYRALGPVTTCYLAPCERVEFHPERDSNPFFHFMEGLWMLAGRNDVEWISRFNKSFVQFSDNGTTFHGAYGHRWRHHFGMDQLQKSIDLLKKNRDDRRVVLQMWDPKTDLAQDGKDFPCNISIFFNITPDGYLDMMVSNRSNDIVWGAYGANAVHMSMLQEYVAAAVGYPVGRYWQVSFNWHSYKETFDKVERLSRHTERQIQLPNPYEHEELTPYSMVNTDLHIWNEDLKIFIEDGPIIGFRDPFFRRVAVPIYQAWMARENKDNPNRYDHAFEILEQCQALDWRIACQNWIRRRQGL